ncbi:hypothetical protein OQH61_06740 [Helicobacter sp. MIT 21-1697]|uniref:hypothetical protein n=1 Tax=Helicobacter sp. MIT 21-1697 TaxID=2993733 RepID=UPI00224B8EA5|nr:hypothetical protein [Helicobacter sp. MIT 21-1697]MCX2717428.1 hypothetical protein [Helicobacter sp. MIT 21-1697]
MQIDEIRIYAECLEQGLDFKDYFLNINKHFIIKNIYPTKARGTILKTDSNLQKIAKLKDFDIVITILSNSYEIPILLIEYSTAVPTDDHKMQRSDVYFWASIFQVPVLKISPTLKNSLAKHGGGDKITLEQEINLALKHKSLVYFVDWKSENSLLLTHSTRLSCIACSDEIAYILKNLCCKIVECVSFTEVYASLLEEEITKYSNEVTLKNLKNNFVNSTRFQKSKNELIVKINRFGHAMDPDRGILFFVSMLFGLENITTKFIIMREKLIGKESYQGLFDGLSKNIKARLEPFIEKINKIPNAKNALEIFKVATGIHLQFEKRDSIHYHISNEKLREFLQNYTSITYKSIFLNSTKLQLCDYHQNILCEISWDFNIVKEYLKSLHSHNEIPLNLSYLSFQNAKEDIITYASVLLFRQMGCEILALSYPGAQGDRAIIIGSGRQTKRIYLDIIAYKHSQKYFVLLHENKEKHNDLKEDERKLLNLKNNHRDSLQKLLEKLHFTQNINENNLYLGLGSKYQNNLFAPLLEVDYIFGFDLISKNFQTNILWNIAVINIDLLEIFKPLVNTENKLQGSINLDLIYKA